jgi:DNA-binding winged helix-turn-helix (wHTH) protein
MSGACLTPGTSRFGRFEIQAAERRLLVDGQPVPLGSRAFDLLAALVARRDRMCPRTS